MRIGHPKPLSALCVSVVALLSLVGCPNPFARSRAESAAFEGVSLVRYGEYIYRVGGYDAEGDATAEITRTSLGTPEGPWVSAGTLPAPRAHAFAFAAGSFLYVVGGESEEGPADSVYYTLIDATSGDLGFSGGRWETSARPLPFPLSRTAGILHDGRIFLSGGLTRDGATSVPVRTIIHARLSQDGQVSHWYRSRQTLRMPASLCGSAILGDRLYVAGGRAALWESYSVTSFGIGRHGKLENRVQETDMPISLASPILVDDGQDLLVIGGKYSSCSSLDVLKLGDGGSWTAKGSMAVPAIGSAFIRTGGRLLYLEDPGSGKTLRIASLESLVLGPGAPNVQPGSGLVAATSARPAAIALETEPGVTVRYRRLGTTESYPDSLGDADSLYSGSLRIGESQRLALQAFSAGGKESPLVKREYATKPGGGFATLSGTIPVEEYPASLRTIHMEEWRYGGTTDPVETLWYRLRVASTDTYRQLSLILADADTPGSPYTGRILFSLFETDMFTHVLSPDGDPIYKIECSQAGPLALSFQAGEYYALLESQEGIPDEGQPAYTLGISVVRDR